MNTTSGSRSLQFSGDILKTLIDVAADADANADVEGSVRDKIACRHAVRAFCSPQDSLVTMCRSSLWYR